MGSPLAVAGASLFLGSSVLQGRQGVTAAKIQAGDSEIAAEQEELGAIQRETDRKARLSAALASQNASAGAKGIAAFEGSPLSILESDISSEKEATQRDKFMSELSAKSIRSRGKMGVKIAKAQSALGLLGSAGSLALQGGLASRSSK